MKNPVPARTKFYILMYSLAAIFAIIGLLVNIKTVPLNENMQKLLIKTRALQEDNQALQRHLLQETRLDKIESIASRNLQMVPEHNVKYIHISSHESH